MSKIAEVVVGLPVEGPFDYSVGPDLMDKVAVGQRVRVLFNRRPRMGVITGFKSQSAFTRLNPILACLDNHPVFDQKALAVTKELGAYYACSWGEAIETWLPKALRTTRNLEWTPSESSALPGNAAPSQTILLHDKSVDKRWPFILEMIQKTLSQGRSVIFLVPETSLIPMAVEHLQKIRSAPVIVLDKKMSASQESASWLQIKEGKAKVIIGTRSAIFAPAAHLGLIVIYEEENSSYKQEQTPNYHAGTVADIRARVEDCSVVYVSCAPRAETWEEARKRKWTQVVFEAEHVSTAQIIDMTNYNPGKTSIISFPLQNAIRETLERKGKVVLLMNRKGFTTLTRCQQCGFTVKCERCNVNLTYLYSKKMMVCRHCNFTVPQPKICPQCRGGYLRSSGTGAEKLESEVARLYPQARVDSYDTDSENFPKEANIIIATKALLRLQTPSAHLIGIINFDTELFHVDLRSAHHAFAFLVRLRQLATEKLLIQTRMVDNYSLTSALKNDFEGFYKQELDLRKELGFPPYKHLVAVGLRGVDEDLVFSRAKELFAQMEKSARDGIEISDPNPDVNPKLRDKYRFTILLKGQSVESILNFIEKILKDFKKKKDTIVTINVDP